MHEPTHNVFIYIYISIQIAHTHTYMYIVAFINSHLWLEEVMTHGYNLMVI